MNLCERNATGLDDAFYHVFSVAASENGITTRRHQVIHKTEERIIRFWRGVLVYVRCICNFSNRLLVWLL